MDAKIQNENVFKNATRETLLIDLKPFKETINDIKNPRIYAENMIPIIIGLLLLEHRNNKAVTLKKTIKKTVLNN